VSVAPVEVRRYYDEHKQEYRAPRTVAYRQLFLPVPADAELALQRARAESALAELRGGADFADLADRLSADGDPHPGGLRTVEVPDEQADWLPPAVEGLQPGQVSQVRELAGGLSIAKLESVSPARPRTFDEVQATIKKTLLAQKRARGLEAYLKGLRRAATIEYELPAPDGAS
jgi:parvulin-like peptidyl-prolyl isomerase